MSTNFSAPAANIFAPTVLSLVFDAGAVVVATQTFLAPLAVQVSVTVFFLTVIEIVCPTRLQLLPIDASARPAATGNNPSEMHNERVVKSLLFIAILRLVS